MMADLLGKWFEWKLRESSIKRKLDSIKSSEAGSKDKVKGVRAAAVQRRVSPVRNMEAYADVAESFVKSAAEQGCDIIAFPEYNFLDLLGIIPGFAALNRYLNGRSASPGDGPGMVMAGLYSVLFSISASIQNAVEQIMCGLALKYRIYIYTGSYFINEGGQLYNGGAVISREGEILGRQKKMHLTDFEEQLGIKRADEFMTFSLDIGKVTFPVCMDATYYEVFNLARSRGCDIVVLPIANNEEYRLYRALRGIWPRVQESHVYGIKSSLNGWFCGMHFTGKAGIFAPIAMTAREDGVVSISKYFEGDSLITGDIDLEELYKERDDDEYYGDCNPVFEKGYYQSTYFLSLKG
ncbi:MAG TPA: nitrilase-related carbon-nitrogen hydrolase [Clostridia bacterium]|nr:nitrilase-related carbon-nitrogen hydrolase [Clostridia bacterium]